MLGTRKEIQPHVIRGLKVGALVSLVVWVAIVALSLNFSSLGMWDKVLPQVDKEHILLGQPRAIRSDEWLANSPIMLAYAERLRSGAPGIADFAGPPGAELLMNQPAPHFATVFRPQFWGFFLFDKDRGFSFLYATKLVGLGFIFYCVALLLCESAVIALSATVWLCFSSFFQWWFSICLPEIVACGLLAAVAAWGILYARSLIVVAGAMGCLVVSLVDFVMCMYPPFMIPIVHAAVAIGLALVLKYGVVEGRTVWVRSALAGVAVASFGVVMVLIYRDVAPVIELVQNTTYPGRRVSMPGGVPGYRYLNNVADLFFTDARFPAWLGNVCEAAGFIVLWPLVIPVLGYRWMRKDLSGRQVLLFVPLLIVLLMHIAWMSLEVPSWFGQASGLFLAAGQRVYVGQGVLGILVVAMVTALVPRRVVTHTRLAWLSVASVVASLLAGNAIERSMPGFLSQAELTLLGIAVGVSVVGFAASVPWMFWCPILWLVSPNLLVNPIARGINPITERKLVSFASKIAERDPNGRWVVFGDGAYANLLKVGGVRVFNGVVYAPRMDDYRAFDPQGTYLHVYNRYAHVGVESVASSAEAASFTVIQGDSFLMKVHPCDGAFEQIGVNYFVFTYPPVDHEIACLEPFGEVRKGSFFKVFRRRGTGSDGVNGGFVSPR